MDFPERLRKARNDADISQEEAAKHINVQRPSYTQYESGRTEPSVANIARLAELFNVSADYLLGLTDNPKPIEMTKNDLEKLKKIIETQTKYKVKEDELAEALPEDIRDGVIGLIKFYIEKEKND